MKLTAARASWLIAGLVAVISVGTAVLTATGVIAPSSEQVGGEVLWSIVPIFFAFSGALIVSSQPRNVIGWLLMAPAAATVLIFPMELHLSSLEPTTLSPGLYLEVMIVSFSWVLLIFPLLHLLQVFPTGKLLSPKWRWLTWLEVGMLAVLVLIGVFAERVGAMEGAWTLENPVGFVSQEFIDGFFMALWTPGLMVLALGGLASSIVRFRRGGPIERRQLGLVLYAIVVFAVVYSLALLQTGADQSVPLLVDVVFLASIVAIPLVIAYTVVRRGLFDIEVIVRRTLVYAVLTGLLAAVYFGSVVVLREVVGGAAGGDSSLSVAASTLLVAALFSPARRRVQRLIERRLFRSRYDAQQVVEEFAGSLRNTADLATIAHGTYQVLDQTVQPRAVGLWIRDNSIPRVS